MEIIPAIDIIGGKCVRLTRGDYSTRKVYGDDPLEVARNFESNGIRRLHLVDLDGARMKKIVNADVLKNISENTNLIIDFGGGVQSDSDIDLAFNHGASMITAGSVAYSNKPLFLKWMKNFGGSKIILGADVKDKKIMVGGWQENTGLDLNDFIGSVIPEGIQYIICTDVEKDGMLQGPSVDLYKDLVLKFPGIRFIASGGVTGEEDIEVLEDAGLWGVIIGKALYEGRISMDNLQKYIR